MPSVGWNSRFWSLKDSDGLNTLPKSGRFAGCKAASNACFHPSPGAAPSWANTAGASGAAHPIQSQVGENDGVRRLSMLAEYREASQ